MAITQPYTLSVAPMMDWTDRHCRFIFRQFSKYTLLYTEMIPAQAIVYGNSNRFLHFHPEEQPLALQVGGSNPKELAIATKLGENQGFREINLNMGCPSGKVANGCFGAKLMTLPKLAGNCIDAMINASDLVEITVKCRIGVDGDDPHYVLPKLLELFIQKGIKRVIIHARKAYLNGLSPKENRTVPSLDYDLVYTMKQQFPELTICINGGITDLGEVVNHLKRGLNGVMVGRAAYHDPVGVLNEADQKIFGRPTKKTIDQIMRNLIQYVEQEVNNGTQLRQITRHMLGLFNGKRGARIWRRNLSCPQYLKKEGPEGIVKAFEILRNA